MELQQAAEQEQLVDDYIADHCIKQEQEQEQKQEQEQEQEQEELNIQQEQLKRDHFQEQEVGHVEVILN